MKRLSLLLALLLLSQPVLAEWDPGSFVQLLGEAEGHYKAGNYEQAIGTYQKLTKLLDVAIDNKEIPAEQLPRAEQALEDIRYQIGRSQQQLGQCAEADATFAELQGSEKLSDSAREKLTVRLVETQICLAEQSLAADNYTQAGVHLAESDARLSAAASQQLSADPAADLSAAQTRRDGVDEQAQQQLATSVQQDVAVGNCDAAAARLQGASTVVDPAAVSAARDAYDASDCGTPAILEYAPYIVMGTGGVLMITGLLVDAAAGDDLEDYENARGDCLGGEGRRCEDALELVNDVESARNASLGLFITGTVLVAGGATWWLLTSDVFGGSEEPAAGDGASDGAGARLSIVPGVGADGASLGLHLQW